MGAYLKTISRVIGSCEILLDKEFSHLNLEVLPENSKNTLMKIDKQQEQIKCALEELKEKKGSPE